MSKNFSLQKLQLLAEQVISSVFFWFRYSIFDYNAQLILIRFQEMYIHFYFRFIRFSTVQFLLEMSIYSYPSMHSYLLQPEKVCVFLSFGKFGILDAISSNNVNVFSVFSLRKRDRKFSEMFSNNESYKTRRWNSSGDWAGVLDLCVWRLVILGYIKSISNLFITF